MSITRVQYKHVYPGTAALFTSSVTTGNLIVVACSSQDGNSTDSTCSDSAGNTYTKITQLAFIRTNMAMWYAYNVTGGTVTVNAQCGSNQDRGMTVVEYSSSNGAFTTDPFDVSANVSNTVAASPQTVNITTTATGFIFAMWADEQVQNFASWTANLNLIQLDAGHYDAQGDELNTSANSYTRGYNTTGGVVSVVSSGLIVAGFKEPTGGGAVTKTYGYVTG